MNFLCSHYPPLSVIFKFAFPVPCFQVTVNIPPINSILFVSGLQLLWSYQLLVRCYFCKPYFRSSPCPCPPYPWSLRYFCLLCPWFSGKITFPNSCPQVSNNIFVPGHEYLFSSWFWFTCALTVPSAPIFLPIPGVLGPCPCPCPAGPWYKETFPIICQRIGPR